MICGAPSSENFDWLSRLTANVNKLAIAKHPSFVDSLVQAIPVRCVDVLLIEKTGTACSSFTFTTAFVKASMQLLSHNVFVLPAGALRLPYSSLVGRGAFLFVEPLLSSLLSLATDDFFFLLIILRTMHLHMHSAFTL